MKRTAASIVMAAAGGVMAQTPTMEAVEFPVDLGSIVTAIVAGGVTVLLLVFAPMVAFKLIGQLVRWLMFIITESPDDRDARLDYEDREREFRRG